MNVRRKLWNIIIIVFVLYTGKFVWMTEQFTLFNVTLYFIGLGLFAAWLMWEGQEKRSGFLRVLLGQPKSIQKQIRR
jgi:hypothetical protein